MTETNSDFTYEIHDTDGALVDGSPDVDHGDRVPEIGDKVEFAEGRWARISSVEDRHGKTVYVSTEIPA